MLEDGRHVVRIGIGSIRQRGVVGSVSGEHSGIRGSISREGSAISREYRWVGSAVSRVYGRMDSSISGIVSRVDSAVSRIGGRSNAGGDLADEVTVSSLLEGPPTAGGHEDAIGVALLGLAAFPVGVVQAESSLVVPHSAHVAVGS